jgi:hypothetical protein
MRFGSEHELIGHRIEPSAKLLPDLAEMADFDEAKSLVQPDACELLGRDPGDDRVMTERTGAGDLIPENCRANAAAMVRMRDVDRVLDGVDVRLAFLERFNEPQPATAPSISATVTGCRASWA